MTKLSLILVFKTKLLLRWNQLVPVGLQSGPRHQNCKMMHVGKSQKVRLQSPKIPQHLKKLIKKFRE